MHIFINCFIKQKYIGTEFLSIIFFFFKLKIIVRRFVSLKTLLKIIFFRSFYLLVLPFYIFNFYGSIEILRRNNVYFELVYTIGYNAYYISFLIIQNNLTVALTVFIYKVKCYIIVIFV